MEFNETKNRQICTGREREKKLEVRRREWDSVMDGTKTRKSKLGRVAVDFSFLGLSFLQKKTSLASR